MKKILSLLITFFILISFSIVHAEEKVLTAGISIEEVPKALFGSWRVSAKLDNTNSLGTFKPNSVDMWNLSRIGDNITLSNPFTGANAELYIKAVEGNLIVFSKKGTYDNKILTDTISIRLDKNSFTGINTLTLEHFSLIDKHKMKTEFARYIIRGEKISGDNVLEQ